MRTGNTRRITLGSLPALALTLAVSTPLLYPLGAIGQEAPGGQQQALILTLDIPAGSLTGALNHLARQAGLALSFEASITADKATPGLKGAYTVEQGFDLLLANSGYRASKTPEGYVITVVEQQDGMQALPVVAISGKAPGSTTEGTGSYTTYSTSSATRLNLSQQETPQSVTVMTRQRMDDQRLGSLTEVLEATPGFSVKHIGGYGTDTPSIYARGTPLSSFQIDGAYTSSALQSYLQSTAIYDRVEIVRGATGLMNSLGTPAATVNMVRKRPTYEPQIKLSAEAGNWDRYGSGVDVSGPLTESGNIRGRVVAEYKRQGNWTDNYEQDYYTLYGSGEIDLSDNTLLTMGFSHTTRNTEAPSTASPLFYANGQRISLSPSDADKPSWTYYDHELNNAFASVEQQFDSGWSGKAEVSHTEHDSTSLYGGLNTTSVSPDGSANVRNLLRYTPTNKETAFNAYLTGPLLLFGREHEFIGGVTLSDLRREAPNYSVRYSGGDGSYYIPDFFDLPNTLSKPDQITKTGKGNTDETQYSAYISMRFHLSDATSLLIGGRVTDWERETDSITYATGSRTKQDNKKNGLFVPYAGIVHDLNDTWSLYASYTEIFNPHQDRFRDINGSPLDPEEGLSYEVGVKASFHEGRLNASLSLYKTDLDNYASWYVADGRTVYEGIDGTETQGMELELNGELAEGWQLGAGYSYNEIRDPNDDRININVPQHMVKVFSTYRLPDALNKITVGGGFDWMSKRKDPGASLGNLGTVESYVLASLIARYDISQNLSVSGNINNLFDKEYIEYFSNGAGAYGPPRNFMASVEYTF